MWIGPSSSTRTTSTSSVSDSRQQCCVGRRCNGWTISGITSWQAGGSLEQEYGGFVQQLRFGLTCTDLPANASTDGITTNIGPNDLLRNGRSAEYYASTDLQSDVRAGEAIAGTEGQAIAPADLLRCTGNWPVWRPKNPIPGNAAYIENDLAFYKTFQIKGNSKRSIPLWDG